MSESFFAEYDRQKTFGVRPWLEGDILDIDETISDGNSTIYTVPANKVLLILNQNLLFHQTSATGYFGWAELRNSAGARRLMFGYHRNNLVSSTPIIHTYTFPIECVAGDYLRAYTNSSNCILYWAIYGVLCDVGTHDFGGV